MRNVVEQFEHAGLSIKISQEEYLDESPRDWCNMGTMVCSHRRYKLGDIQADNMDDVPTDGIVLPLYLYDHSGITMNTTGFSCHWDSGQVGVIYASRADILKEYNCKRITNKIRQKVIEQLQNEVSTYDQYLRGDVYYYTIEDEEGDVIGSFGGMYGIDYCISEAKQEAEYHSKQLAGEAYAI